MSTMSHHTETEVSSPLQEEIIPVSTPRPQKKKLTRADSPPPDPGIIRDLTPADVSGNEYIGADVNIMFFSENAAQKIMNGENVIIMPVPGKKWDPEASQRRLRAKYPELNNITKASLRRMRREWGR
ncbi:MAG: hypothetical protein WCK39_11245 [Methanomassiliicoccales archaeon]